MPMAKGSNKGEQRVPRCKSTELVDRDLPAMSAEKDDDAATNITQSDGPTVLRLFEDVATLVDGDDAGKEMMQHMSQAKLLLSIVTG